MPIRLICQTDSTDYGIRRTRANSSNRRIAYAAFWKQKTEVDRSRFRHTVMSVWTVRKGGLNTSLPRCVHPPPIKLVFYERPRRLVSTRVSRLDAFSVYPLQRGCPAVPCRTTGKLVAARPCSSRTRGPFVSGDCDPRS